jgi:CRP/FNR family transcriptional regulator, nitrogen oxide reductase regulator
VCQNLKLNLGIALQLSEIDIGQLGSLEYFDGLDHEEMIEVAKAARPRKYEAGSFIFFESDPATEIFVLQEGQVRLLQTTPEGQQVILSYLAPGSAFGIIAALGELDYLVTAEAVSDCLVACWDRNSMYQLMLEIPRLSFNALKIFSKKIKEFQDRIRELSTERVERRIARAVLRLGRQIGRLTPEGVLIDMPISREDLGDMTGTTLFTVSRTLSKWESLGLISCSREKITIKSPHMLVSIAEDINKQETQSK